MILSRRVWSILPRSTERMGAAVQQPWAKRTGAMFLAPGCVYSPSLSFSRTLRLASTSAASAATCAACRRCLMVAYSGPVSQALGGATGIKDPSDAWPQGMQLRSWQTP
jgi:hypothetical protein